MTGGEFIKRVRRLGKSRGVEVHFVKHRGKGSHGTLYYGNRKTTVKDRHKEI
jgi:mRNA interferase HicA